MVSYWCVYWPWQNYHVKAFTWVTDLHRTIKAGCSQDLHKMIKVRHSCVLTKWSLLSTPLPGISTIRWITSSGLKWPATILAQRSNTCWKLGNLFLIFLVLDWLLLWFQNTMKTVPFASKLLHHQRCPWSCDQDSQGCPDCCFKLGWHNPRQNAQLGVKGLKVNSDRFLSGSVV